MPFDRQPKPETLAEFGLYSELLAEAGKQANALDDALISVEQREAARAARRRTGARTPDQVGRGDR
jgi:hypothetical protein